MKKGTPEKLRFGAGGARRALLAVVPVVAAALALAGVAPAEGGIVGLLEAPTGIASGISNVQGWVYTTTPGAKLVQPFDVLVDGVKVMQVPCCADRGDVQAAHPEAPLATGFSAVFNWSLALSGGASAPLRSERAQGEVGPLKTVSVVVTDDRGGSLVLGNDVAVVRAGFDFNRTVRWNLPISPTAGKPAGGTLPSHGCMLVNTSILTPEAAEMICTGVLFEASDHRTTLCSDVVYWSWDRASQSFRVTSDCVPPPGP